MDPTHRSQIAGVARADQQRGGRHGAKRSIMG
jgi:hypothetical protein